MVAASGAHTRAVERVRELASGYRPPDYSEVPGPDPAIFLCAIDHRTGYRGEHEVGGEGPYAGSALLWALALAAERRDPGLLSAPRLTEVDAARVAELFEIGGETVAGPDTRAELWRDLATGLVADYGGRAEALLAASGGRIGGAEGLVARLTRFEAYSDPLRKKAFLFTKICERRGWLSVADPESWEVCADNVLMRLALRSGLVGPASGEEVRGATMRAFKSVASDAGIAPPLLDDMLWEQGREDPDLLGVEAGDLREPPRPDGTVWY